MRPVDPADLRGTVFFKRPFRPDPEPDPAPTDEIGPDADSPPEDRAGATERRPSKAPFTTRESVLRLGDGLDFSDRRGGGRLPIDRVGCDVGRVLDLSRHGMRVERPHRLSLNAMHTGHLVDPEFPEEPIEVSFRCVWEQRLGWRSFQYGIAFQELDAEDQHRLAHLAASCRRRRVI